MSRPTSFDPYPVRKLLNDKTIATIQELKRALGTSATMTVYRVLSHLDYRSSYSHRGKFYTLEEIAEFDEHGLWSHRDVCFSRYGSLVETAKELVDASQGGFTVDELEDLVRVNPKQALLKLYRSGRIDREKIEGIYVHFSSQSAVKRRQLLHRQESHGEKGSGRIGRLSDELKAAVILFYSLLDEKLRRLFAGLESQRHGHGGDSKVAEFLGLDIHTVAKGRRELFSGEVDAQRVRRRGGGRKTAQKKRPK